MLLSASRGPEIESWFGVDDGYDPATDNDWSFLPFMALSDGAHTYCIPQAEIPQVLTTEAGPPKTSPILLFSVGRPQLKLLRPSSAYRVRGRWMPMSC